MTYYVNIKGDEPHVDAALLTELGRVIMYWAWFENWLVINIDDLVKIGKATGSKLPAKMKNPRTFRQRIDYWLSLCRIVYEQIPHYIAAAEDIHLTAVTLSEPRNMLIHGFLAAHGEGDGSSIELVDMKPNGDGTFAMAGRRVDSPFLENLRSDISRLYDAAHSLKMNYALATHRFS